VSDRVLSHGFFLEIGSSFHKVCLGVEKSFSHHAANFVLGIISGTAIALLIRVWIFAQVLNASVFDASADKSIPPS
jgi:hypothetical protein